MGPRPRSRRADEIRPQILGRSDAIEAMIAAALIAEVQKLSCAYWGGGGQHALNVLLRPPHPWSFPCCILGTQHSGRNGSQGLTLYAHPHTLQGGGITRQNEGY